MNMNTLVQKKTDQYIKIEKKESPNGISNIGNSCYMNAAFQTIVHIFGDFFIKGEYNKKLSQNQYITDFVKDFAHLMASIQNDNGKWKKEHVSFYLGNVIKYLSKIKNFKKFTKYKRITIRIR